MNYYADLDLTILGQIVRNHPEAIKVVKFADGIEHKLLPIRVYENEKPDSHGSTHSVKAGVKKESQKPGERLYLANLKPSSFGNAQAAPAQTSPQTSAPFGGAADAPAPQGNEELPF